jgi:hypothetical protein
MADMNTTATIQLVADKDSAEKTRRLLAAVEADIKSMGKGDPLRPLAAATVALGKDLSEADKRALQFANRMVVIRDNAEDLGRTYDDLIAREKRLNAAGKLVPAKGAKDFDSIGASGDVASATGGLRGAFDVLGVAADSTAGKMLELGEALGDVGEYGPKLVQTVSDFASKGGPATTAAFSALSSRIGDTGAKALIAGGSMGVATIALGAMTLAIQQVQKDAEAAQKGLSEAFSARDKVNAFRDSGGTEAQARSKIAQVEADLKTAQGELALAQQTYAQAYKEVEDANGAVKARFGIAAGFFSEFQKRIEETSKRVQDLTAEYDTYNAALSKGTFAKDAQAAAQALESGAKAMEQTAAVQLTAADKQKDAALAQAEAASKAEESARKASEAQLKFAQDVAKVNQQIRDQSVDARTKASQTAQEIGRDFWDDIGSLSRDAQAAAAADIASSLIDEREAYIAHRDALADLSREALKDQASALKERNFLQAATESESLTDAAAAEQEKALREAQARQRSFEDASRERDIELGRERQERRIAADIQRRELDIDLQNELRQLQTGKGRQLEALRMSYDNELVQLGGYLDARAQMIAGASQRELGGAASSMMSMRVPARMPESQPLRSSFSFGGMQAIGGQSVTNNMTPTIIINGAQDVQTVRKEVLTVLNQVRYR